MCRTPGANDVVTTEAAPLASSVAVPTLASPSKKVTVPVAGDDPPATVALSVTAWP
jgi:hypothetical protein